jgi:hypothetical protein
MENVTVNTVPGGYEATHPDYPGKVGKGKSPQDAIDNLDKIKGRKRRGGAAAEDAGAGEAGEGGGPEE